MKRALLAALGASLAIAAETAVVRIDAIFQPLATSKTPGLAVLVRENGRTLFERAYGVRDLRTLTPIDWHTNFRLASFTKQFTAMAVMLLVHDGKLRYNQTLTDIFPEFPAYGRTITIRHLLTHTAGLPDYEDLMPPGQWTPAHQIRMPTSSAFSRSRPPGNSPLPQAGRTAIRHTSSWE